MVNILTWLIAIELLGILVTPLCFLLFQRLPDRGITLAKPLALVLISYILWIAGLTNLIPNTQTTVIAILVLTASVAGLVFRATTTRIMAFLREEWRTILVAETVFLIFFFLWLGVTSESPNISGTEKPMDFGFMNAVLQSRFFPPEDPWLAGHSINYYYFGHFMMAFLVKLTAVPSSVGYNLSVSLLPALVAIGSFGLLYNLVRLSGGSLKTSLAFGLAAPAMIMLIGNLEGTLEFVHTQGWGSMGFWRWVGIDGLEGSTIGTADNVWKWMGGNAIEEGTVSPGVFPDAPNWWWHATRVINTFDNGQQMDYTITEFPMFSFLLGDLHAHVISLPFLILNLGIALNLFQSKEILDAGWLRRHLPEAVSIALFTGSLAFINLWDLPLLASVLSILVLIKNYGITDGDLQRAAARGAAMLVPIMVLAVVLFLPFYWDMGSHTSGILPLRDVSSRPFLFFMTMGVLAVMGTSFIFRQLSGLRRPKHDESPLAGLIFVVALAPFVIWSAIILLWISPTDGLPHALRDVAERGLWVLPGLLIASVAAYSAAQRIRTGNEPVAGFMLLIVALAFYLLVGAELFYVNDLFGGAYRRMNTVFKVYYQSWLLLAVVGAYGLYYWSSHQPRVQINSSREPSQPRLHLRIGHYLWMGWLTVLLAASVYYSVGAVLARTGALDKGHSYSDNTLNGLGFIREQDPGEYNAISWLRDDAPWGRIVEAVGDDYSDFGRISASTGFPTVLGWKGHELQWRGTSKPFAGREKDIESIYRSTDGKLVLRLLEKYDVRYVYLGRRERAKYEGGDSLQEFYSFLKPVFQMDSVIIYEMLEDASIGAERDNGQG